VSKDTQVAVGVVLELWTLPRSLTPPSCLASEKYDVTKTCPRARCPVAVQRGHQLTNPTHCGVWYRVSTVPQHAFVKNMSVGRVVASRILGDPEIATVERVLSANVRRCHVDQFRHSVHASKGRRPP